MARIKGTSLIEIVRVLRKNREVAETLIPETLHAYLTDRLLPSSWYPEEEYLVLLLGLGKMLAPLVSGDVWEFIGERGAEKDFGGLYSTFVRKGDPWGSLLLADKIWTLYRDTGKMEIAREASGSARIILHDYPSACPEVCGTVTGYFRKLLEMCDAKSVRAKLLRAPPCNVGPSEWLIGFRE